MEINSCLPADAKELSFRFSIFWNEYNALLLIFRLPFGRLLPYRHIYYIFCEIKSVLPNGLFVYNEHKCLINCHPY